MLLPKIYMVQFGCNTSNTFQNDTNIQCKGLRSKDESTYLKKDLATNIIRERIKMRKITLHIIQAELC